MIDNNHKINNNELILFNVGLYWTKLAHSCIGTRFNVKRKDTFMRFIKIAALGMGDYLENGNIFLYLSNLALDIHIF